MIIRRRFRKNRDPARARRAAGCAGLPPQSRGDLVGDCRVFGRTSRRRPRDRQRHRTARCHLCTAHAELVWWPSDIFPSHLASIDAWRQHEGLANLRAPQRIDLTDPAWTWQAGETSSQLLAAMLCINVLHISPWQVSQNLFAGAGRLLRADGRLFVYGPFMRDGEHTAPSNAAFDATLRAENPEWGVRDIRDLSTLADKAGLSLTEIAPMPANNLVLAFTRALRHN